MISGERRRTFHFLYTSIYFFKLLLFIIHFRPSSHLCLSVLRSRIPRVKFVARTLTQTRKGCFINRTQCRSYFQKKSTNIATLSKTPKTQPEVHNNGAHRKMGRLDRPRRQDLGSSRQPNQGRESKPNTIHLLAEGHPHGPMGVSREDPRGNRAEVLVLGSQKVEGLENVCNRQAMGGLFAMRDLHIGS